MATYRLKLCPFCGSSKLSIDKISVEDREGHPMAVRCQHCGAVGPFAYCKRVWICGIQEC